MTENSAIEWTDHTFNPWWGCTKVSPGCKNCYAESITNRWKPNDNFWGMNGNRRFFGDKHWKKPLIWNRRAEKLGIRYKVFCGSMCDVFENREDLKESRNRLGKLIKATPNLDWLLLTKRPENIYHMCQEFNFIRGERIAPNSYIFHPYIPENVWLGTSVENQEQADIRIPKLLEIPAKIRFLSIEPLLEKINITFIPTFPGSYTGIDVLGRNREKYSIQPPNISTIHWVIVGGESGLHKRPFDPNWARSLRDECKKANVPFFMKQIDKIRPIPNDLMIREYPNE